MRRAAASLVLASALAVFPSVAHSDSDVTLELDAGAGGDTSAPGGFATARATLDADATHPAGPLPGRGLCAPQRTGWLWLFTGLDPDERDGAGASLDATAFAGPAGRALVLDGHAWARGAGWGLALAGEVQPVGDLRDRFWRSGRGVAQLDVTIDIPAMWAVGTQTLQLLAALETIKLGARRADGVAAGFDDDLAFTGFRVQTPRTRVDVFGLDLFELGVARQTIGGTTYGTSASGFDLDVARVAYHLRPDLELDARGGVAVRSPIGPYMATDSSTTFTGPAGWQPSYWIELRDAPAPHRTIALGAGNWLRLDPSGHAVDAGQLATLELDQDIRVGRLRASLEGGRLRRVVLGELAPAGLPPVGTRMWMGRATVEAAIRVTPKVAAVASAWLERSDRDDPRWIVPASGALATHTGADLTVRWVLAQR